MNARQLSVLIGFVAFASIWTGCANQINDPRLIDGNEITHACAIWEKKRLENYDMIVRYSHGGMVSSASPVVIEVRGGKAVNIRPIVGDQRPIYYYSDIDTVDKILERIRQNNAEGGEVIGSFNPEYGYPARANSRFPNGSNHFYDLHIDELIPR